MKARDKFRCEQQEYAADMYAQARGAVRGLVLAWAEPVYAQRVAAHASRSARELMGLTEEAYAC